MSKERRLLTLGGSSGIGQTAHEMLVETGQFQEDFSYGIEHFDVRHRIRTREAIRNARPTDLVFSVGINRLNWLKKASITEFDEVMTTNVYSFMSLIRLLDEEECGPVNIVVVTSDAAWRPMRTSAIYCASKAALEMTVRVASREYAPQGWRINAVAPGKVEDTPMTEYVDSKVLELRGWTPEQAEAYELSSTPLGRKVTKQEVGEVIGQVLFGPAAQTGEIIAVNGGR